MDNKNKNEQEKCEDCGGAMKMVDARKGELECESCGLTIDAKDVFDTNEGKTTFGGDSATHEAVRNDCDINERIGTGGSFMDTRNLSAKGRKQWNHLRKVNRSTVRIKHPLADAVRKKIKQMYGTYAMQAAEPFVKMMCKPLKGNLEQERQALTDKSLKKRLGMPKQSICRKKEEVRGCNTEQNVALMAMAAVEVAGEFGLLSKMDRRSGMEQDNISRPQLINAKRALLNHYKARITMGWEVPPVRKKPGQLREDGVEQAVNHTHDMLSDVLTEEQHLEANYETEALLALLSEGTDKALTMNTEVRMAVCVAFYATLVRMGIQAGMADRLGAVFGLTGSGIRSRYEAFVAMEASGEQDFNGAFLDGEMTCLELLATLHPAHTLIQRAGLASLWNSQESASS
ncbi:TFIIB-type zinc ribbon-containing protein [Euryarchaeota archaeon]|nr:TFIIB-type zinc ribbon-containing protein [Euryarchaeota archaeon]